jgi:hypothetical protein
VSAEGKIARGAPPDPELVALVRALARADAEDDYAPLMRLCSRPRPAPREEEPSLVYMSILPAPEGSHVYFMRAGDGPVKIGCSLNPEARRRKLQTASGERLKILAVMPGGREHEHYLHGIFAGDRKQGEWFSPSRRLLTFIEGLK